MKQPIKNCRVNKKKPIIKTHLTKSNGKVKRVHPKFGTSKLEQDFAEQFLDKLDVEYVWQFEAKEIGRFYDFKIKNGPILEINGSYWHGDERIYEKKGFKRSTKKSKIY